jgi:RNA recognition motif-containing protein
MATKLYVGNLPWSTTDEQLKELFSQAGTVVSATVIKQAGTERSKGFGFAEMSTEEEAQAAIAKLNGYELEGRKLVVNEARPLVPREPGAARA